MTAASFLHSVRFFLALVFIPRSMRNATLRDWCAELNRRMAEAEEKHTSGEVSQ